jgi:REP element-mobilizing transposase RayT
MYKTKHDYFCEMTHNNEKFQNKYRILSARATWHDYSGGAYFITVCTKNREHSFGEIINIPVETWCATSLQNESVMQLTKIGQCLHDNLQNATAHYLYAEIPLFVVMPNHFHAIVFIDGEKTANVICRDVACHVSDTNATANERDVARHVSTRENEMTINDKMKNIRSKKGWLSVVIGGIKSAVTKYANENGIEFAWQSRFHDCIIRDQKMMNTVVDYIEHNVVHWNSDCFNALLPKT